MEDNFDKILANRIKELVDANEVPYNAAHWNQLLAKKDKKKKRAFIYWRVAAVLVVGLLAGIGTFYFSPSRIENNPSIILDKVNDSLRMDSIQQQEQQHFITAVPSDSISNQMKSVESNVPNEVEKSNFKEKYAVVEKFPKKPETIENSSKQPNIITLDSIKNADYNEFIVDKKKIKTDSATSKINRPNKVKESFVKDEIQELIAFNEKNVEKKDSLKSTKPIKIGVDFSPVFNYNQTSPNESIGFAGGITVDFPISNKFDLTTGVFYANQKLDISDSGSEKLYMSDAVNSLSSTQTVSKEAIVKGIEIPFNVKYNFSVNKKDFFVAAGFTSTSYIKETIESKFIVNTRQAVKTSDLAGNSILQYNLVQTESTIETPSDSNGFNFANNLNFSIGVELPLNKNKQSIIVAPYFKYALKSVTEQNLDFSNVGIHMRYNLNLGKK